MEVESETLPYETRSWDDPWQYDVWLLVHMAAYLMEGESEAYGRDKLKTLHEVISGRIAKCPELSTFEVRGLLRLIAASA